MAVARDYVYEAAFLTLGVLLVLGAKEQILHSRGWQLLSKRERVEKHWDDTIQNLLFEPISFLSTPDFVVYKPTKSPHACQSPATVSGLSGLSLEAH